MKVTDLKIPLCGIFLAVLFWTKGYGQDTFSIIAADPETGEIGSAGASCVDNAQNFGGVILLNEIIPGRGGINAQAYICINPHINLVNGIARMGEGMSPEEIIDWLINNDACFSANFNPEYRQYGIVDFDGSGGTRSAAFTGSLADDYKGHLLGPNYSIQGNILLGPEVLDSMESRFVNTEGPLAVKLMAALQGANIPGADSRCLDEGTSSKSAFLRVSRPDDTPGDYYLEINVAGAPNGVEPIDSLQYLFNAWADSSLVSSSKEYQEDLQALVYPNPAGSRLMLEWRAQIEAGLTATLYDMNGSVLQRSGVKHGVNYIDLSNLHLSQLVFLQVSDVKGETRMARKIWVKRDE